MQGDIGCQQHFPVNLIGGKGTAWFPEINVHDQLAMGFVPWTQPLDGGDKEWTLELFSSGPRIKLHLSLVRNEHEGKKHKPKN